MGHKRGVISLTISGLLVLSAAAPAAAALPLKDPPCGHVVKRSFRLMNDMTCTGSALVVGRNGVTIHLNGKKLSGDGDAGDYGIDNTGGFDDVTIKRGRITSFEDGINVGSTSRRNTISRVRTFGNSDNGIVIQGGTRHAVLNVTTNGNDRDGLKVHGDGGTSPAGTLHGRTVVRYLRAIGNGDDGIDIERGVNNQFRNLVVVGNGGEGIDLDDGRRHVISVARIEGNGHDGVEIDGGRGHTVAFVVTVGNDDDGIDVNSQNALIQRNRARDNGEFGITFFGINNTVKRNHACGNGAGNYDKNGTFTFQQNTQAAVC